MAHHREIFKALEDACARQATIEFLAEDDASDYAEKGMKAKILRIEIQEDSHDPHYQVWKLRVDYSDFDEHNRKLESATWYDKHNSPCLTARQANGYKPQEDFYINQDTLGTYFRIIDSTDPLDRFVDILGKNIQSKIDALGSSGMPLEAGLRLLLKELPELRKLVKNT